MRLVFLSWLWSWLFEVEEEEEEEEEVPATFWPEDEEGKKPQ
jgi:hypothetical protein